MGSQLVTFSVSSAYSAFGNSLKPDLPTPSPYSTHIQPSLQILALTHIELFKFMASFDNRLNARAGDAHTAANRQRAEFEKVQADGAKGGVGHSGAAEGEIEFVEIGAAESKDFCGGIGEGAAK